MRPAEDGPRAEEEVKPKRRRIEVEVKPEAKARPPLPVAVRVVQMNGPTRLVEWLDEHRHPHRSIVPREAVHEGYADEADLLAGVPWGLPWEEMGVEPQDAITLRQEGVWTADDLHEHWPAVKRALGAEAALILSKAADEMSKEV